MKLQRLTWADRVEGGAKAVYEWVREVTQKEAMADSRTQDRTARQLAYRLAGAVLLGADEATPKHAVTGDITDRLRGKYVIPVNDGAGLLDGKDTYTRAFTTPPIQHEAAALIDDLQFRIDGLIIYLAQARHALRVREGHHTAEWDGLSDEMRAELVFRERQRLEPR